MQFETCQTGKNDYLESVIGSALPHDLASAVNCPVPDGAPDPKAVTQIQTLLEGIGGQKIPPECILAAMEHAPLSGGSYDRYGVCDSETSAVRTKELNCKGHCSIPRPCLSSRYLTLVYDSFVKSMQCLGIDPKETFPMFGVESGFQVNIGDPGGWGIAQLTPGGVRSQDWARTFEPYKSNPACASVQQQISTPMSHTVGQCERISIPTDPTRSFLMGGKLYLENKSIAQGLVNRFNRLQKTLPIAQRLNAADRNRLLVDLTRYMYNGGAGTVSSCFKSFLEEPGTSGLTYRDLSAQFIAYLKDHLGEGLKYFDTRPQLLADIRRNVPGYAKRIRGYGRTIAKSEGIQCSD